MLLSIRLSNFLPKGEQQQPFLPVSENTSNPFNNDSDEAQEDTNLDMLYEDFKTYAVGHGEAASWDNNSLNPPLNVSTSTFAEHDVPNITQIFMMLWAT